MSDAPDSTVPRKGRRHMRRWVMLAAALLLVAWFGRFAYLRITLRPTPRPEYWQAKLEELYPLPADALTLPERDRILADRPWETATGPGSAGWRFDLGPADDASRPLYADADASREFQKAEFQKARAAVIEGIQQGWRGDLLADPWNNGISAGCFQWAAALIRHARWSREQAANGQEVKVRPSGAPAAREDWLAVLHMGRQLQWGRRASFAYIWTRIEERLADELIQAAARDGTEDLHVREMASEVDAHRLKVDRPSGYFEGDRIALHAQLEQCYVREGGNWMDVSQMVATNWFGRWRTGNSAPSRIWNLASPVFHTLEEARSYVDNLFTSLDRPGSADAAEGRGMSYGISGHYMWFAEQTLRRIHNSHTLMDAALAMLALRVYRDRNGRYPERLEELVPDYLPRLPMQHRDAKPLEYRRTARGYEIRGAVRPAFDQPQWGYSTDLSSGRAILTPEGFQEVQP